MWRRRLSTTTLVLLAFAACYRESLAALSDYLAARATPTSLDLASRLTPLNSPLWRDRGIRLLDTDPRAAESLLRRAISLNAFEVDARIGLGLLAESSGRLDEAEAYLLKAASLSRRFKPQWALAYYYARHDEPCGAGRQACRAESRLGFPGTLSPDSRFWNAARIAANVPAADAQPIYRLAHQILRDPADLLALQNQRTLAGYIEFLLKQQNPSALGRIALRIDPVLQSRPLLLTVVDRLVNENRIEEAVPIWNRLVHHPLVPEQGASLTHGAFEPGIGQGFDWRYSTTAGIDLRAAPADLRVEFSGRQPESATLLEQFAPVLPNRTYRFSFHCDTTASGVYWQVSETLLPISQRDVTFRTNSRLIRIALRYTRPPGAVRFEGAITLRSAKLELL